MFSKSYKCPFRGGNIYRKLHFYGDNFFQNIGFASDGPLQMHYFGDNFDFQRLYLIVIITKISIEQALIDN